LKYFFLPFPCVFSCCRCIKCHTLMFQPQRMLLIFRFFMFGNGIAN